MQDFLISRNRYGSGSIYYSLNIQGLHFTVANSHNPVRVKAANMAACYARINRVD